MIVSSKLLKGFMLAASLSLAACGSMGVSTQVAMGGTLAASNEVPSNASMGSGVVEATFDKETNKLNWKVTYAGVTGPVSAGHFHGPATAGQNAGVALGFKGDMASPIIGEATLTPAQAADLLAGKWYVNLHTKSNPGGELRAQVLPH